MCPCHLSISELQRDIEGCLYPCYDRCKLNVGFSLFKLQKPLLGVEGFNNLCYMYVMFTLHIMQIYRMQDGLPILRYCDKMV